MRGAIFRAAGMPLVIEQLPMPEPQPGQAVIRVQRCGICASDLHMTSGSPFDLPAGTAPGHEYAGEVVELGPGEALLRIGDRVTALPMSTCGKCAACRSDVPLHCTALRMMQGGYSEYTLIDQRKALCLPRSLSFEDGALVEPLAAGLRGVGKLALPAGARIAVIGAGAIGAAAIFWLRRKGAGAIAAVARSRRGEELVRAVGGDSLVTAGADVAQRLADALGGPPDIVVEAAGAPGTLQQAVELSPPGGTVLSLGGCTAPDTIVPLLAMWKELKVLFSAAYGVADFRHALDALDAGFLSPRAMVGETIALGALPGTFESMRSRSHAAKVMVDLTA